MKRRLAWLVICCCFLSASLLLGQAAAAAIHGSKAEGWAEAVTSFMANPRLRESFSSEAAVAERFQGLIPAGALRVEKHLGFGANADKGVAALDYNIDVFAKEPKGQARINWVTVYMPVTDSAGVKVLPLVREAMKRKLVRPWRFYEVRGQESYYWEQRRAFVTMDVELAASVPKKDGTPNAGPWVTVRLARVESFEER